MQSPSENDNPASRIRNNCSRLYGCAQPLIYKKATSEIKFVDGRASFTMVHEFMSRDGSRISTVDTATGIQVPGIDEVSLTVMHKVVDSTGKFEGLRGTFPSFGLHNFATGKGVQRFGGELS